MFAPGQRAPVRGNLSISLQGQRAACRLPSCPYAGGLGGRRRRPPSPTARGEGVIREGRPMQGTNQKEGFARVVDLIAREQRNRGFEAVRSLWRTGDALTVLREIAGPQNWRRALHECARSVGVTPASLDEAIRAARAFPEGQREALLRHFEDAHATLTPSHAIELARVTPRQRARGIEALLCTPHSIRQLRCKLRMASGETVSESERRNDSCLDNQSGGSYESSRSVKVAVRGNRPSR